MKKIALLLLMGMLAIPILAWTLTGGQAAALAPIGPDRDTEFGTAKADYTLSNSYNVKNATDMQIPIYYKSDPGTIQVAVTIDSGDGCIQLSAQPFGNDPSNNKSGFTPPAQNTGSGDNASNPCYGGNNTDNTNSDCNGNGGGGCRLQSLGNFKLDPNADSGNYKYFSTLYIHLPGGVSGEFAKYTNNKNFNVRIPTPNGRVAYSHQNKDTFAIANTRRCDSDTGPGCKLYWDYNLPFAGACDQPDNDSAKIKIYDGDNTGDGTELNIQPTLKGGKVEPSGDKFTTGKFVPGLYDVTNAGLGGSGTQIKTSNSGSLSSSNDTFIMQFHYKQGHSYVLRIHGIYSNNVLQFQLPYDSIYANHNCQWSVHGTTGLYATARDGSCTSSSHGRQLSDGYQITQGDSAQYVCYKNTVTNDEKSNEKADISSYGVRYTTYDPGGGGNWRPQLTNDNGRDINPPSSARDSTNNNSTIIHGACAWPNLPNSGLPKRQTVPPYSYWSVPVLATNPDYSNQGGAAACNNAANPSATLDQGDSISNTYTWHRVKIPADTPVGTKFCEWVTFTPYDYPAGDDHGYSKAVCFSVKAPEVNLSCNDLSDTIINEEADQSFIFNVTIERHVSSYDGNLSMTITPHGSSTGTITKSGSVSGPDSNHTFTSATYRATPGSYDVTYDIGGKPVAADGGPCTGSFKVGYEPYFSVVGGDTSAGGAFGSGVCTLSTSANIESWNNDNDPPPGSINANYKGAGSQMAAFAGGDLAHFITSLKLDSSGYDAVTGLASSNPHALSFANYSSDGSVHRDDAGAYGGSFGQLPCMHDYLSDIDTSSLPTFTNSDYATSNTYQVPDGFVFDAANFAPGGKIPVKTHLTIVVKGDAYIASNILYGSDGNLADIPSISIYATSGIYINGEVKNLHGTFEAKGTFATCATNGGGGITETTTYSSCSKQLDIYGSVSAKRVDLDRSYKSLNSGGPAETFHYTPEEWLPTGEACIVADTTCPYAAFTSLPPVL